MPIYEFVCNNCDLKFEKLVFGSCPQLECPECHKTNVKKVPSVFGFSSGGRTVTSSGGQGCVGCSANSCEGCR